MTTPSSVNDDHVEAHASSPSTTAQGNATTRRDLTSWWKRFNMRMRREEEKAAAKKVDGHGSADDDTEPPRIFGVPLHESIKYANVAISLTDADGQSFIYGYVPIVVAKCGVFLKEKATEVEGIFRLSGSSKRIKDLQRCFNAPDRYGKGLDWTGFTVHDAANILRRYLNQLPEPIVPLEFYGRFRDPLMRYATPSRPVRADGDPDPDPDGAGAGAGAAVIMDDDAANIIAIYQQVITELPPLNRQLLLYILDLLAVFASKSDINRMTSNNLAAIFQPGILSHPQHDMDPGEYRFSQDVLMFLIENQDHFLIGMRGTAADEATVRDVQRGGPPPSARMPSSPPTATTPIMTRVGRSASDASNDDAESVRRLTGIRRHLSSSSKHSGAGPSPGSPGVLIRSTSGGVYRSNTVPAKKSPGLVSHRYARGFDSPTTPTTPLASSYLPPTTITTTAVNERDEGWECPTLVTPSSLVPSSSIDPVQITTTTTTTAAWSGPMTAALGGPVEAHSELAQRSAPIVVDDDDDDNVAAIVSTTVPEPDMIFPLELSLTTTESLVGRSSHDSLLPPPGQQQQQQQQQSSPQQQPPPPSSPRSFEAGSGIGSGSRNISPNPSTAHKERNFSNLFSRSPTSDGERRDAVTTTTTAKVPNKLRKKRGGPGPGGDGRHSPHHSTHSLHDS